MQGAPPRAELLSLTRRAFALHAACRDEAFLVRPSVPVLYFGDLPRYLGSPRRIVTVGLNPSRLEFPSEAPFLRFPRARGLAGVQEPILPDLEEYLRSLDEYFRTRPYRAWFDRSYGGLLQGLDAGFYGDRPCTALHTDLCSPLATDPTWSGLRPADCRRLMAAGVDLWHDLIGALAPDVALVSVRATYLGQIRFPAESERQVLHRVDRRNPYEVRGRHYRLPSGKRALVVFGRAAQQPFGLLGAADQQAAGRSIAGYLSG